MIKEKCVCNNINEIIKRINNKENVYVIKIKLVAHSEGEWSPFNHEFKEEGGFLIINNTKHPSQLIEQITIRYIGIAGLKTECIYKISSQTLKALFKEDVQKIIE